MAFLKSGLDALLGRILRRLGLEDASELSLEGLGELDSQDLLDLGHRIGLEIEDSADANETAERVWLALQATMSRDEPVEHPEPADDATDHIPWSYGQDVVTGIAVDPDRLYVCWEVTDEAIAEARRRLGKGGAKAWLNLRIYDTSGRLFDGTNAHSHFDQGVGREDRQWFLDLGKPGSEAFVEVGLKSSESDFAKIARSGRVEFPRWGTPSTGAAEWMTVHVRPDGIEPMRQDDFVPSGTHSPDDSSGGDPGSALWAEDEGARTRAGRAPDAGYTPPGPPSPGTPHPGPIPDRTREWVDAFDRTEPVEFSERTERVDTGPAEIIERHELREESHSDGGQRELGSWSWESGPEGYPVRVPGPVTERFLGGRQVRRVGERTHVVYGPWEVVIHGIDAHMEKTVLGRWETFRSWVAEEGGEVTRMVGGGAPGSSEQVLAGASERRWRTGSESRLGGASEAWRLGASERRLGGASQYSFLAASERMLRGASERRFRGASERRLEGAGEQVLRGASERLRRGASERLIPGASERRLGGASERKLGGASERVAGGSSERRFPPPPEPEQSEKS